MVGLTPPFLLSFFIFGLTPDLRREVQALPPLSLPQTIALSKLQEDKLQDRRFSTRSSHHPLPLISLAPSVTPPSQGSLLLRVLVKRLSTKELVIRQDKGLYFHCDDKWVISHRCKSRLHLLITDEDLENPLYVENQSDEPLSPPTLSLTDYPLLSLNVLTGMQAVETFCIFGTIHQHKMTILVDRGSTHNFVQPRVASFLNLPTSSIDLLQVMVGNNAISCSA